MMRHNIKARLASVAATFLIVGVQLFAPIAALVPKAGATAAPICSGTVTVDEQGANDEPGQKDLTQMCADTTTASSGNITVAWSWDDTSWSGNNTGDGCALFDTDGDGKANYSLCATVGNNPAAIISTSVYQCGDTKSDRCANPITAINTFTSQCGSSVTATQPFNTGTDTPNDTTATCHIVLNDVGGVQSTALIDVCSYPSQQPNSDPSDCIVAATTKVTTMEVIKHLVPSNDPGLFNLFINGTQYVTDGSNNATTDTQTIDSSHDVTAAETAGTGTSLSDYSTSASCTISGKTVASATNLTGTTRSLTVSSSNVKSGDAVTCIFTNTRNTGSITLIKHVVNDNGGTAGVNDFGLSIGGTTVSSGAASTLPTGSYVINEAGLTGYQFVSITGTGCPVALGGSVNLTSGQNVTCTITNDDVAPQLHLRKTLTTDNGGTASATAWTLSATGSVANPTNLSGSTPVDSGATFKADIYALAEANGPAGYTAGAWDCGTATMPDATHVTVPLGADITCAINNDDDAPVLTLKKIVVNNTGSATADMWTLAATGPSTLSGTTGVTSGSTFKAGTYTLSESGGPSGYDASAWTCTNNVTVTNSQITLTNGQSTTCTITNTQLGAISGYKYEANADKSIVGTSGLGGWTINLLQNNQIIDTTTTDASGAFSFTNLINGTYALMEQMKDGWTQIFAPSDITLGYGQVSTGNNFGNFENGSISGVKFNDHNANGVKDSGDENLSGWTIQLEDAQGNVITSQVTTATGYSFTDLAPGSYKVCEVGQTGWVQILPGNNGCYSVTIDTSNQIVTDKDFGNQGRGTITVVKNVDTNGDGTIDQTDVTNWNWDINGSGDYTTGSANSQAVAAGDYTVSEQQKADYHVTTSSCTGETASVDPAISLDVTVSPGENVVCTFTNTRDTGSVTLVKHVDNTNGGTASADQFQLHLMQNGVDVTGSPAAGSETGTTYTVPTGTYSVNEDMPLPDGYKQVSVVCDGQTTDTVTVIKDATKTCTITNASIAPTLTIVKIASPQIDSFSFTLNGEQPFTLTGDGSANGQTSFTLHAGSYTIAEQPTNHWYTIGFDCNNDTYAYDSQITVDLGIGDNVTCTVYNYELNTITGSKFNDLNNNGIWDKDEPALAGWTINLTGCAYMNVDQDCTDVAASTVTDATGAYSFGDLYPGDYTLCEVQQSGWMQTYPTDNQGCQLVSFSLLDENYEALTGGQAADGINFGNFQKGEIKGVKFNDFNGNGKRDAGETTLKNWQITLTKLCVISATNLAAAATCQNTVVGTVLTDQNGAFSFTDLEPGDYKLCETQKTGWKQTFPGTSDGCYSVTISTSGQVVTADFGNHKKPEVLGELVNTGANASLSVIVGLFILGSLGAVTFLNARRQNTAE